MAFPPLYSPLSGLPQERTPYDSMGQIRRILCKCGLHFCGKTHRLKLQNWGFILLPRLQIWGFISLPGLQFCLFPHT